MDSSQIIIRVIIILISLILAAYFVASEFALVQSRPSALEDKLNSDNLSKKQQNKLKLELNMVTHLNDYLSTTQVGVSIMGIVLGWIGESLLATFLVSILEIKALNISSNVSHIIGGVIGVLLLTYIEVVFTEIVPKNISIDKPLEVLNVIATPLAWLHKIFYPLVWILNKSATAIVKLLGFPVANENDEVFSQSEILRLSRDAVKNGTLENNDYVYMQRAFELNDKSAKDIMVDRTQLNVLDINSTVKDALHTYLQDRLSRYPVVAKNDKDKILGYVYNYDIVRQAQVDPKVTLDKLLRPISTTAETTPITQILQQMIKRHQPITVVVDEYGGTSGIITDNDIYEELFGTVRDEVDPSITEEFFKQPNGNYQVSGKVTTYDFERYFKTKIKAFNDSDIITLSGFIIEHYPNIKTGDTITIGKFKFKVLDYENSFINWLEVTNDKKHNPKLKHHDETNDDKNNDNN